MNQASIELHVDPQGASHDITDGVGFDIGWDHAHHGLVPPPELLLEGTPLGQGWRAGRAVFGHRTLHATPATRLWLALRTRAWREGVEFDLLQVTPHYLAQLQVARCPVRRTLLGGAPGQPDAAVVERLNPQAAWAAGNLAVMSQAAAQARAGVDIPRALRHARSAQLTEALVLGLSAAAWWRLAALQAFATPLPFANAVRVPLALLPPNRVRLLNAAQGLQALLTLQFSRPGWAARTRALAQLLPEHTLRTDFNLFVGALVPRVLEAGGDPQAVRLALEDAWLGERVQRRWQHLLLSLGEVATARLLDRAAAEGLAGLVLLNHGLEQAVESWALTNGGRAVPRTPATATSPRRPLAGPRRTVLSSQATALRG